MEIEQNVGVQPPMEESKPENSPKKNGSEIWVIILNIFLALVTIFLLAYVAYKNGYIDLDNVFNVKDENKDEQSQEEEKDADLAKVVETEEEEALSVFEGDFISAITPEGWRIEEYSNGEGSNMLVSGVTYTGLTGLKVFNGDKEIMQIGAVSGIGFVGCSELPIFPDSSAAYRTEMEEMNIEVGIDMNILDYVNAEYSDFEWFGKDFRRVETSLYYDSVANNDFFEPQCEKGLVSVPGFSFSDGGGYSSSGYYYGLSELATELELEALDGILASMTNN